MAGKAASSIAVRFGAACAAVLALAAVLIVPLAQAQPKWADPAKTLRVTFPIAETGFDPQATSDYYSSHVERAIFDPLYQFDYLARPHKIVPNTAAAMPEISADGRTWKIRVRPGIYFTDDPAFKGKKRELVAEDYVYSLKRLLDPKVRAPMLWFLDGKVAGSDDVVAKAKQAGRLDYDVPIEGLKALDRYTLQIKLKQPDYVLLEFMHPGQRAASRSRSRGHSRFRIACRAVTRCSDYECVAISLASAQE